MTIMKDFGSDFERINTACLGVLLFDLILLLFCLAVSIPLSACCVYIALGFFSFALMLGHIYR